MPTIETIVRSINRELTPQFEERLRAALAEQDREWLIDQIVRLTLDAHSLEEIDRRVERRGQGAGPRGPARTGPGARPRSRRPRRVRRRARRASRGTGSIADGRLRADAPAKGTDLLLADATGPTLARRCCSAPRTCCSRCCSATSTTSTHLERVQQELLTMALPRFKAGALDFMRASTELAAAGTWQDPDSVSNDERADNVLLEVQFGETADELVGARDRARAVADQQPRGQRAGALRPHDQRRGDDAHRVSARSGGPREGARCGTGHAAAWAEGSPGTCCSEPRRAWSQIRHGRERRSAAHHPGRSSRTRYRSRRR